MKRTILLLGGGGREHAIAWKLTQSSLLSNLYIAPGNAGTAVLGINLDVSPTDFTAVKSAVMKYNINMVIVGPEDPLVQGISDFFRKDPDLADIPLIGPPAAGAILEGSKEFAKQFMVRHNIPTASYRSFDGTTIDDAVNYLDTIKPPYVLKADGLAAGKGVLILNDKEEAAQELHKMLIGGKFGNAGKKVVIEEFLNGIELSVFVLTNGEKYVILPEAKDYKRIGEGDTGPNTGGMGTISPVPFANKAFLEKIDKQIISPTIEGLKKDNIPYNGFLFFGLIKVKDDPFVIEYNVRLGDPEAESIIPRIENDLLVLFNALDDGTLSSQEIKIDKRYAATVMMVSGGYPGSYEKGKEISIPENLKRSIIFHAGTKAAGNNIVTSGGRVLGVTSLGENLEDALKKSYLSAEEITFEKSNYRKDLGQDLMKTNK